MTKEEQQEAQKFWKTQAAKALEISYIAAEKEQLDEWYRYWLLLELELAHLCLCEITPEMEQLRKQIKKIRKELEEI